MSEYFKNTKICMQNELENRSKLLMSYAIQLYKQRLELEKSDIVFPTGTKQILAVLNGVLGEANYVLVSKVRSINLDGLTADRGNNIEDFVRSIEDNSQSRADCSMTEHKIACQVFDNILKTEHQLLQASVVIGREFTQMYRKKFIMMSIVLSYCTPCANQETNTQPVPEPDVDQEQESDPGPEPNLENPKYTRNT